MFEIAIFCTVNQGKRLTDHLLHYSYQKDIELEVSAFSTCGELCEACAKRFYDLIFLDIDGAKEEIQEIGAFLRDEIHNEETAIVFISKKEQCSAEYIKLQPRDYLIQPITYKMLDKCMDSYMKSKIQRKELFSYKKNRTICTINVSRIIYLQSVGKKVVIHTQKEKIEFYGKLSKCIQEVCFNNFIDIHQSFFINSKYIERVEREYVILAGNIRLLCSAAGDWRCENGFPSLETDKPHILL